MTQLLRFSPVAPVLAAALAVQAHADVRITASAPVSGRSGSPAAPFDTVSNGDIISVSLRVSENGVPGSFAGALEYDVLPSGSSVETNGTILDVAPGGTVELYADGTSATMVVECFTTGGARIDLILIDTQGPSILFGSNLIADILGTYLTADASSFSYQVNTGGSNLLSMLSLTEVTLADADAAVGTAYCPAVASSTGVAAQLLAAGSVRAIDNDLVLEAHHLPANQFGLFVNGRSRAFVPGPGGSQGNLCLGGGIGRYNQALFHSGAAGEGSLRLDLAATPTPTSLVAVAAGETWTFQCWFRDANPTATSNFTNALEITFE